MLFAPTIILELIANYLSAQAISQAHFSHQLDFIDIFLRRDISSLSRAHAFLWLCYHYLEGPSTDIDDNYDDDGPSNPFADHRRGNMPSLVFLSETETAQENNDPPEEIALAGKLVAQRAEILRSHEEKESNKALITASAMSLGGDEEVVHDNTETKMKGRRGSAKSKASTSKVKKAAGKSRRSKLKEETGTAEGELCTPAPESDDGYDAVPQRKFGFHLLPQLEFKTFDSTVTTAHPMTNQYPHQYQRHPPPPMESHVIIRHSHRNPSSTAAEPPGVEPPRHRFSPYRKSSSKQTRDRSHRPSSRLHPVAPRSMLQRELERTSQIHYLCHNLSRRRLAYYVHNGPSP
jgi:Ino eighty subunit 1